jgi:hypothetical protein
VGEQIYEYATPESERRIVCIHCRSRAEAGGWVSIDQAETMPELPSQQRRRSHALRGRLSRSASR